MENRYYPTEEQKKKFIPMIEEYVNKVNKYTKENNIKRLQELENKEALDFYYKGISPSQLKEILYEIGFTDPDDGELIESNGYEWDYWIYLIKDNKKYVIAGTGMTFEMVFRIDLDVYR